MKCSLFTVETVQFSSVADIVLAAASAGGLTAAAACFEEPSWLRGLHLVNPFLDPVTALMDPDANLTTTDWAEFGDPRTDPDHRRMLEHLSPMKIVGALPRHSLPLPPAWIRGARSDSRVDTSAIERFSVLYRTASNSVDPRGVVCRINEGGHLRGLSVDEVHQENLLAHAWLVSLLEA